MRKHWVENLALSGVLSILLCLLAGMAYLSIHHEVPIWVCVRALAGLCVLNLLPGYVLQRFVFRVRPVSAFETMLSSLLLGVMLVPLIWYGLGWLGVSATTASVAIVAAAMIPLVNEWYRERGMAGEDSTPRRWAIHPRDTAILWLALLLMVIWSYETALVEIRDGRAYTVPSHDLLMPAALVGEFSRGIPLGAVPFVAGVEKLSYHYMSMVWCDMLRHVAGTDAMTAYFHLALPLRYLFMAFGGYLVLVRRFGRTGALAGVACMFAVVDPVRYFFPGGSLILLHYGYTASFGLVGTLLSVFYVSIAIKEHRRGALLTASIVSVLLLCYKANFALVVAPAVAIYATVVLLKSRDYRWLALCLGAQTLVAALLYWQISNADMRHTLVMAPLAYLQWEWMGLMLPAAVKVGLHNAVASLPGVLEWPAIFVLWLVYRWHVGIVVLLYMVLFCRFGRSGHRAGGTDRMILLLLGCCALGFVFLPIQENLVWNIAQHLRILVHVLLFALIGPALCSFVAHMKARGRPAMVTTSIGLVLALVANGFILHTKALSETRQPVYLGSEDVYSCYRFIRASTPPDSVILHPTRYATGRAISALTQRRMVLDIPETWSMMRNVQPIADDVRRFYQEASASEVREILERYRVDYVLAERSPPGGTGGTTSPNGSSSWMPADDTMLMPVFQSGGAVVYQVDTRTAGSYPQ